GGWAGRTEQDVGFCQARDSTKLHASQPPIDARAWNRLNTPTARNAALLVARDTSARVSTQCRMRGITRGFATPYRARNERSCHALVTDDFRILPTVRTRLSSTVRLQLFFNVASPDGKERAREEQADAPRLPLAGAATVPGLARVPRRRRAGAFGGTSMGCRGVRCLQ